MTRCVFIVPQTVDIKTPDQTSSSSLEIAAARTAKMLTLRCHVSLYKAAMVCMCLVGRHSYLFLIKRPSSCGTTHLSDLLLLFNVLNQVVQKNKDVV